MHTRNEQMLYDIASDNDGDNEHVSGTFCYQI